MNEILKCRVCEKELKAKDLAIHSFLCYKKFKWAKKIIKINNDMFQLDFQSIRKRFSEETPTFVENNSFCNLFKSFNVI
jgi:hypothetical protein